MLQASTKVMLKHNRNFTGQFLELKDKEVVKSRLTNAGFSDIQQSSILLLLSLSTSLSPSLTPRMYLIQPTREGRGVIL